MIKYDMIGVDIFILQHVLYSLYELELEKSTVTEIVLVEHAIESLKQSFERLEALREEIE